MLQEAVPVFFFITVNVSSINLLHNFWWYCGCPDSLDFQILHEQINHNWADGRPHCSSLLLLIESTIELEISVL